LDFLALGQPTKPSSLDRADMDEGIWAAAILGDEAEALLGALSR
jgi:hypothetical protein